MKSETGFEKPQSPFFYSWRVKIVNWFRLRKLEWDLRSSKQFQRECRKIRCHILAELEGRNEKLIRQRIQQLQSRR